MDFYLLQKTLVKIEAVNMVKNLLTVGKKSTTDAIKTATKTSIQEPAEATGDWIGNKIADKITGGSKKSLAPSVELCSQNNRANNES